MPSDCPFRCLIVAAVSTKAQAGRRAKSTGDTGDDDAKEGKYSIDNQLATCRAALAAHPAWTLYGQIIIRGHSRSYEWLDELTADCRECAACMRLIRSGEIALVTAAFDDRLWRTMELGTEITRIMSLHHVQLLDCSHPKEPVPPDQIEMKAIDCRPWAPAETGIVGPAGSRQQLRDLLASLPQLEWEARRAIILQWIRRAWLWPDREPRIEWP